MSYVTQGRHGLVLQEAHAFSLAVIDGGGRCLSRIRRQQKILSDFQYIPYLGTYIRT